MYFIANWKMYLNESASVKLAAEYRRIASKTQKRAGEATQIILCPSDIAISSVRTAIKKSGILLGAQDGYWIESGAYTGAVSMQMLEESGVKYVLVGHSERRHQFNETNSHVIKKLKAAWNFGLTPVLCVGETREEHAAGKREQVLKEQLAVLKNGSKTFSTKKPLIIAYEPVWAIGTGVPCNPAEIKDVVEEMRVWLKSLGFGNAPILYGGSVDSKNIYAFLKINGIQGVLSGGSSAKSKEAAGMLKKFN